MHCHDLCHNSNVSGWIKCASERSCTAYDKEYLKVTKEVIRTQVGTKQPNEAAEVKSQSMNCQDLI